MSPHTIVTFNYGVSTGEPVNGLLVTRVHRWGHSKHLEFYGTHEPVLSGCFSFVCTSTPLRYHITHTHTTHQTRRGIEYRSHSHGTTAHVCLTRVVGGAEYLEEASYVYTLQTRALLTCTIVSSDPLCTITDHTFTHKEIIQVQHHRHGVAGFPLSLLALSNQPDGTHSNYTCAMLARPTHHAPRIDASRRTHRALHPELTESKHCNLGLLADGRFYSGVTVS